MDPYQMSDCVYIFSNIYNDKMQNMPLSGFAGSESGLAKM